MISRLALPWMDTFTAPREVVIRSKCLGRLLAVGFTIIFIYFFVFAVGISNQYALFEKPVFLVNAFMDSRTVYGLNQSYVPFYCNNASYAFGTNLTPEQSNWVAGFVFPPAPPCRVFNPALDFLLQGSSVMVTTSEMAYFNASYQTGTLISHVEDVAVFFAFGRAVPKGYVMEASGLLSSIRVLDHRGIQREVVPEGHNMNMTIRRVLELAGIDLDSYDPLENFTPDQFPLYRLVGVEVLAYLQCSNNQYFQFLQNVDCTLSLSSVPGFFRLLPSYFVQIGSQTVGVQRFGVQITLISGGAMGGFSFGNFIAVLVSFVVLLRVASQIVDFAARFLLPARTRARYRQIRFSQTQLHEKGNPQQLSSLQRTLLDDDETF